MKNHILHRETHYHIKPHNKVRITHYATDIHFMIPLNKAAIFSYCPVYNSFLEGIAMLIYIKDSPTTQEPTTNIFIAG